MHGRYVAHIPTSNIIVERGPGLKERGHVGDERGTPIVNRVSPCLTHNAVRLGPTTLANVIIDGGVESCLVGKTSVGLRIGWCAGNDDDGEEGNSTMQEFWNPIGRVHGHDDDDDVWLR